MNPHADTYVLALPAECVIAGAADLRTALQAAVSEQRTTTLDASAVQRIDTAGLQLLAAFVRDRRAASRQVAWAGASPAFIERAKLLDLQAALQLSEDGARAP